MTGAQPTDVCLEDGSSGRVGTGLTSTRCPAGGGLFQQPLRCHHPLAVTTSPSCPLFPTELVLVLETSSTVSPALFSRMKELLALLLRDLQISPSGCPAGARVAMLAYAATPTYLLRAGEMGSRTALLNRLRRLSPTRSSRRGRLAAAMRFVGHHVLKRVRPAALGRKVVLFVTSGRNQNLEGIGEVALQYEALGIVPAVLTFNPLPEVVRAFQVSLGAGGFSPRSLVSPPSPHPSPRLCLAPRLTASSEWSSSRRRSRLAMRRCCGMRCCPASSASVGSPRAAPGMGAGRLRGSASISSHRRSLPPRELHRSRAVP